MHLTDDSWETAEGDEADIAPTKVTDHTAEAPTPTAVVTRAKVPVAEVGAAVEVEEAEIFAG